MQWSIEDMEREAAALVPTSTDPSVIISDDSQSQVTGIRKRPLSGGGQSSDPPRSTRQSASAGGVVSLLLLREMLLLLRPCNHSTVATVVLLLQQLHHHHLMLHLIQLLLALSLTTFYLDNSAPLAPILSDLLNN